ncbi:hypothetical protein [Sorangium sp. So ce693]|uniref:hypothetical protein n=1 Tax=Sorangium sp. So ce693 TaxID=3133318 RepID=UPI003F5D63AE
MPQPGGARPPRRARETIRQRQRTGRRAGGPLGLFLQQGPRRRGGYGGPGRGGDSIGSIGIAYLDEGRLTVEGVTFTLGPPGKGGIGRDDQGKMISGEDGIAVEALRFPE